MKLTIQLILRVIIAIILVQTLRYKFTADLDSVYIYTWDLNGIVGDLPLFEYGNIFFLNTSLDKEPILKKKGFKKWMGK